MSGHIIERLSAERGVDLDAGLTPQQLALGHVVRRTIEEHLYFHGLHGRWVDDAGFAAVSAPDGYFSKLSGPARFLISRYLRRNLIRMSWRRGWVGTRPSSAEQRRAAPSSAEQRRDAAQRDVDSLATLLADREYLLGSPSTVDATLLGFGWGMVVNPYPSMVADAFNAHPNLVAYIERMKGRYWADWAG
ncbi:MAG: glutathione S-transferase family protein [Proteobacteria bacterium]|nr:glutathione S-transferase family protein [Pseudomonadota bacterium]MCP4917299.1 glutathione S-transferase family protein [Pseudomonadota bacterium]